MYMPALLELIYYKSPHVQYNDVHTPFLHS